MGKNDRFDRIYSQGTMNVTEIWVYREIGVNYVFHAAANAGGMTPLLDREGKLVWGCGRFLGPELSNSKTASILHRTQTP